MSTKALYEHRLAAHNQAIVFLTAEKFDAEKRSGFEKAMTDVKRLTAEIAKAESRGVVGSNFEVPDANFKREAAFGRWLRGINLEDSERRSLEFRDVSEGNTLAHIGTYTGLGYLVPTGFSGLIEQALKYFAPLADGTVFKLWNTSTGNPIPYPISDDTANAATVVGEAGNINEADITANQVKFGAYKLSSGVIKCSLELLQDSGFDVEAWLAERFGERYGRGLENYLTNGTGPSGSPAQPTGLLYAVAASGVSPVIASGSSESTGGAQTGVNSIGYSDLVNLEHSVDPAYRRNASYMFHDQTLSAIQRIIDKFGRPLWAPGISADVPDTINGYPYTINQAFPQIGASNVTVAFGDMTKFVVRKVSGFSVQRLNELFATTGQVGFISNMRVDSQYLDAGQHPINVLQQHS